MALIVSITKKNLTVSSRKPSLVQADFIDVDADTIQINTYGSTTRKKQELKAKISD